MARKRMKAVEAWALVSVDTGEALRCDSCRKIQQLASWMTNVFGQTCRIARVRISEIPAVRRK